GHRVGHGRRQFHHAEPQGPDRGRRRDRRGGRHGRTPRVASGPGRRKNRGAPAPAAVMCPRDKSRRHGCLHVFRRRLISRSRFGRRAVQYRVMNLRAIVPPLALALLALEPPVEMTYPPRDVGVDTLAQRKQAQIATGSQFRVFHDFHFTDRIAESGITFVNHAVDDEVSHYRMSHYDHGTGVAVADVDGDGWYDIYFVNQVGGNELWKNLGGGRFTNVTREAGVAVPGRISVAAAFADIDNDGDEDLFVTTVRGGNVLLQNDGHGKFTDISKDAGVNLSAHSSGAMFVDYDGDGLVDLFVCNVGRYTNDTKGPDGEFAGLMDAFRGHLFRDRYEQPVLYRNLGHNKFADVTAATGLQPIGWSGDATFADLNGDGRPDLVVLNMAGQQHYYENVDGKRFADKSKEYFPRAPFGAMGVKLLDFDNDGRMDVFVTDMHSDMVQEVGP